MAGERHLTAEQLAERLQCRPQTLAEWRCKGVGPKFVKFGVSKQARVRYRESDVDAWIEANVHENTQEAA